VQYLTLVIATSVLVALRAFQGQNVIHKFYYHAVITSFLLAIAEVTVIVNIVNHGLESAIYVGLGGAMGVVFAMWSHPKFVQKVNKDK